MTIPGAALLALAVYGVAWLFGPRLRRRFTKTRPFCTDYDEP